MFRAWGRFMDACDTAREIARREGQPVSVHCRGDVWEVRHHSLWVEYEGDADDAHDQTEVGPQASPEAPRQVAPAYLAMRGWDGEA